MCYNEMLDSIFTEERKKKFLKTPERPFIFKDGDLYVGERGAGGTPPFNKLVLEEVRYPDEKTIFVNMTSFGDKTKWETEKYIEENFTVKFVRTDDSLRIAECGIDAVPYLYY